ncbi:MAG: pyruvate kinase, partial [Patescibacteria group bacterium]|nr:pyruvate kinase [Patescibacteria group bacterium]
MLDSLREEARSLERKHARAIAAAPATHRDSARNLLHYLALRQWDISELQRNLAVLGLSRLGRAEANVMASLGAVTYALHRLAGRPLPEPAEVDEGTEPPGSAARLEAHTDALLGRPVGRRAARIMVTMPTEAADDPDLICKLLAAGMDLMRLNCAHDGPEAWHAMIAHLRAAEKTVGRSCKIYADLQGPKLRTGAIRPVGRLVEFGPQRDVWGAVVEPARLLVVPRGSPVVEFAGADAVLPMDPSLVALVREGDEMMLEDSRGSRRHLTFV